MKKTFIKAILAIGIIIVIYLLFINICIYPVITEGMSMFPTIAPNEIKLTNRWIVATNQIEIERGMIVIIEEPSILYVSEKEFNEDELIARYDYNINLNPFRRRWMKRIIGLPNDHIQITERDELYINGVKMEEDYTNGYTEISNYMYVDLVVPEDTIFVMGDNREESTDSRSFGCIPISKIYSILE